MTAWTLVILKGLLVAGIILWSDTIGRAWATGCFLLFLLIGWDIDWHLWFRLQMASVPFLAFPVIPLYVAHHPMGLFLLGIALSLAIIPAAYLTIYERTKR